MKQKRQQLETWARSSLTPSRLQRRSRVVLAILDGEKLKRIARDQRVALGPAAARSGSTAPSRARVLPLVRAHGSDAMSFLALESGLHHWIDEAIGAAVAYPRAGGAWVAACGPLAADGVRQDAGASASAAHARTGATRALSSAATSSSLRSTPSSRT